MPCNWYYPLNFLRINEYMKIAVMGGGWLGLPLAVSLHNSGHQVVATRRSKTGLDKLSSYGLTNVQFELGEDLQQAKFASIFSSDLLFLNIPVGRKSAPAADFQTNVKTLLKRASVSNIKHVIFISTTSVFGDTSGIITEHSETDPTTQSGHINLAIEQLVARFFGDNGSVVRLAGLVGDKRHPAKFLAGKTQLKNPNQSVNLIHQHDVINAVHRIIDRHLWGETFILSAIEHPTRKDYYTWAAKQLGLVAPTFVEHGLHIEDEKKLAQPNTGKVIDATVSLAKLDLELAYPSPYHML